MVFNRAEVVTRAKASTTNVPGTCQLWTRERIGVGAAGDVDHDGDADAVDGWKSEPEKFKHRGDRHPPAGVPVSWSGGSHGFGHRAISLGPINGVYMIRSTDAGGQGRVATVPLTWVENSWGLHYEGWSASMDGVLIPLPTPPKPPVKKKVSRGVRVDRALKNAKLALKDVDNSVKGSKDQPRYGFLLKAQKQLDAAIKNLEKVPFIK